MSARVQTRPVGILGGMGPAAGADFVRRFVDACTEHLVARGAPVSDQAYPRHCLVQVPVPDRSTALAKPQAEQPLEGMKQAVLGMRGLGVESIAIACNTAHAWHGALQGAFPELRILHAMDEVADDLRERGLATVGLLATEGTYATGLYQQALSRHGILCAVPDEQDRACVMEGIYQGVKAGRLEHAAQLFEKVAGSLVARHELQALILGCTEIPLAFPLQAFRGLHIVDPADMLARKLAACAYGGG